MVRVAFYSHDTFGLGHLRRCLKLIRSIDSSIPGVEGLLITGSPWAQLFSCSRGFEYSRLPPVVKRGSDYRPLAKGAELSDVLAFRARRLRVILGEFRPHLLVVDNVPCGLKGELLGALRLLQGDPDTKCVLALRDVLDRPERVAREWTDVGAAEALERLYHEVWIFGDEADVEGMRHLPGMSSAHLRICGRIGLERDLGNETGNGEEEAAKIEKSPWPHVLVTGGGGGDASALIATYVEMLRGHQPEISSHIVLGPDYPIHESQECLHNNGFRARIDSFVADVPREMEKADLVVAMSGYNTICEIEALGKRAVLVPRVWPREEQLLRARKQERAGRATVVHPGELAPVGLLNAIQDRLAVPSPRRIRHYGARNAAQYAAELLDRDPRLNRVRIAS